MALCRKRQEVRADVLRFLRRVRSRRHELQQTEDWVTDLWYVWLSESAEHSALVSRDYLSFDDFRALHDLNLRGGAAADPDAYRIPLLDALVIAWKRPIRDTRGLRDIRDIRDKLCCQERENAEAPPSYLESGARPQQNQYSKIFNNLQFEEEASF